MAKIKKNYFLCGGVLFFLLTEAALPNASAKDHEAGVSDEHSGPILMRDLIYAFCGNNVYGTPKDTSLYKECKIDGSKNIPFDDVPLCNIYCQEVRDQYNSVLSRMDEFVRRHLNPKTKDWFVKAVLEIIENDPEISDDETFFISPDGTPANIYETSDYDISSFLVGILHFITCKRRGKNKRGVSTLNSIGEKKSSKPRKYTGDLGEAITKKITVDFLPERIKSDNQNKDSAASPHKAENNKSKDASGSENKGTTINNNASIQQQNNNTGSGTMNITINYSNREHEDSAAKMIAIQQFSKKYYQLIVTRDPDIFENNSITVPADRALNRQLVPHEIFERCSPLEDEGIEELKTFPAIICKENTDYDGVTDSSQNAIYGYIKQIKKLGKEIKIVFMHIKPFPQSILCNKRTAVFFDLNMECALTDLNQSAWSVHKANLFEAFDEAGMNNMPRPM